MKRTNPRAKYATHQKRKGYALILVVFIAAIGGMAVIGISHSVRFETLEMEAKRKELATRHTAIINSEKSKARAPAK